MYSHNLIPAKRYLDAARKAGWFQKYNNAQALECGWCISYETVPSPAGRPKTYRRSLHGLTHSIGNDGRLPFRPEMLEELPPEGGPECRPFAEEDDADTGEL